MSTFNKISANDYNSSTVSNLRARIFAELWETDTELFPNSITFQWIKDALNEINLRDTFNFQESEWLITLNETENKVSMPSSMKQLQKLRLYVDWVPSTELDLVDRDEYSTTWTAYAIRNNTLLLPTAVEEVQYVVEYLWIPDLPANELSNSLLPSQYDQAIINFVVAKAKTMEWQMSDAHYFMKKFEQDIEKIKENSFRRTINPTEDFWMTNLV